MVNGQTIVIEGAADQLPDTIPGDLILIIREKEDPNSEWHRSGNDLLYDHTISLIEALTGWELYLHHLDDRVIHVSSKPNEITNPDDIKIIKGEGMPIYQESSKGDLYIRLKVEFPKQLTDEQRKVFIHSLFFTS